MQMSNSQRDNGMSEYNSLLTALRATGIPTAEFAWSTRPTGTYGVISLESDNNYLYASDTRAESSCEGSIDLFCAVGGNFSAMVAYDTAIKSVLGTHYALNSVQVETDNNLIHFEWVFYLNGAVSDQWQT